MSPAELEEFLTTGMRKATVEQVVPEVIASPILQTHLLDWIADPKKPRNQKAAYLLRHVGLVDIDTVLQHADRLIHLLDHPHHSGIRRDILRLFTEAGKLTHYEALTDRCFKYLRSPGEATAVKYLSMQVLAGVTKHWPDLGPELADTLESQLGLVTDNFDRNARKLIGKLRA